jgi:DNA-binding NarL/FixJ family response regulator
LELLLQGQPNKLIARHLNLSVETVKDHVASLLRVLGVSSRTQAVLAVGQMLGTAVSPAMPMGRTPPSASRVGLI